MTYWIFRRSKPDNWGSIRDNHSAHVSKETKAWLAKQPEGHLRISRQLR